jgi:hypothetical protein
MKGKILFILILLILTSCRWERHKNVNQAKEEFVKLFPKKEYIQSVASSVLKFSCTSLDKKGVIASWSSHCCLYANKGDESYIAIPKHCFDYDDSKSYEAEVKDIKGRIIKLNLLRCWTSTKYDAVILTVKHISGIPTLCSTEVITSKQIIGDSAVVLSPFNVRGIYQKFGFIIKNNSISLSTLITERGDSGGLVIVRDGVIGIHVSSEQNGKVGNFVPIAVFEDMYAEIVNQ